MPLAGSPRSSSPSASVSFALTPEATSALTDEVQTGGPYGHGNFQRQTLFFGIAATAALICHSQSFALISGPVDHWCKPPSQFSGLSVEAWKNVGIPLDKEGRYSQCYTYVQPSGGNDTGTPGIFACTAWDYDQERAGRSARSFWNMVCHRQWMTVLADAVYMNGALVCVPLAGYLADMTGRRPVIIAAVATVLFGALGSCCADTYVVYVATRFVTSGSVSSVFVISIMLIYEVTPFKYQTSYLVLVASAAFVCADGFVLLALQLHMPWFWLQTVLLSPMLLLLSAFCVISESPLWLITMSRFREAEEAMKRAAKINGAKLEGAQQTILRMISDLKLRQESFAVIGVASARELRERATIVFLVTFATMLAYYRLVWALLENLDAEVSKVTSLCVGIPSYVALCIAVNVAGSKQILMFLLPLLGGLCSLCAVAAYAQPWYVFDVLMIVAKQCALLTMPANYVYIAELFPTGVRCAVMCAAFACGRVGAIVASSLRLLKQYELDNVGFAIVGSVVLASLLLLLELPETRFGRQQRPNKEQRKDLLFLMQQSLRVKPRSAGHRRARGAHKARRTSVYPALMGLVNAR